MLHDIEAATAAWHSGRITDSEYMAELASAMSCVFSSMTNKQIAAGNSFEVFRLVRDEMTMHKMVRLTIEAQRKHKN
jgi:hypothetical protein